MCYRRPSILIGSSELAFVLGRAGSGAGDWL